MEATAMIISLVNQKGGVGKTTVAINLAAGLVRHNRSTLLIDADPQGSVVQWQSVENNHLFEVRHIPGPIEKADVEPVKDAYDYILIDAPPAFGEITISVLGVCDAAVIPVTPSPLDMWSCRSTLEMIENSNRAARRLPVKLLINRKIVGTRIGREAREAVEVFHCDVLETELYQRVAYVEALVSGVSVIQYAPGSKAAGEVKRLCEEIMVELPNRKTPKADPRLIFYRRNKRLGQRQDTATMKD
jgi:chromosome partitioning protein